MANWYEKRQRELNKNKMKYPQEFIDKIRNNFPEDEEMNALVDEKSFLLGEYLKKVSSRTISAKELSSANKNGTMDELVKKADQIKVAKELFASFINLYDEQYRSKGHFIQNGLHCYSSGVLLDYKIRKGEIKVHKVKVDPVKEMKSHAALVRKLEQNEARRRAGEEIARNMWCGGPGSRI